MSLCLHADMKDNPLGLADFETLWTLALNQGIAVGAFLNDGSEKPELLGLNGLLVETPQDHEVFDKVKVSRIQQKRLNFEENV